MIMFERQRQLATPLQLGRAAKIALVTVLVAVAVGLVLLFTSSSSPRSGCIEVVFPSTLGAAQIEKCGAKARALCANPHQIPSLERRIREACRRSGIPS